MCHGFGTFVALGLKDDFARHPKLRRNCPAGVWVIQRGRELLPMNRRRKTRAPLVVTFAVIAPGCLFSCGGSTSDQNSTGGKGSGAEAGTSTDGGGTTSVGGTSGSDAGGVDGAGAGGATGGIAGSGGGATAADGGGADAGACPASLPWVGHDACTTTGQACTYDIPCQSGTLTFTFLCGSGWYLSSSPGGCAAQPYDSCPNTRLYCNGIWSSTTEAHPPLPCPTIQPAAGSGCYSNFLEQGGYSTEKCGYACGSGNQGWIIATCDYQKSQWTLGTCEGG